MATDRSNFLSAAGKPFYGRMLTFWTIVRHAALGEMSLVRPRRERAVVVERLERMMPGCANRLAIFPGVTGLSQLRSGYDESLRTGERRIRYDILYVRRAYARFDFENAESLNHGRR
jgi:lipopolysaccharide/colanic/teichoic acid biosynthesis glycosyltransferase